MAVKYIPSLNGLRAISIVLVIVYHYLLRNFAGLQTPGAQIGVNIFFIVSGFLITLILLDEENKTGTNNLKKFYVRRVFRIFPLYYSLLLVYFILEITGVLHFHINSWITSLTFTKYFYIPYIDEWESSHLWSLSIEEHFYLVWPFIFKFLKPHRQKIAVVIILLIPVLRAAFYLNGIDKIYGQISIFQRADALMMGCLLAIHKDTVFSWIDKLISKFSWLIYLPIAGLFVTVILTKLIPIDNQYVEAAVVALGKATGSFTNISICLAIIISVHYKSNIWYRFLNTPLMNYIGKLSFSLYIWQQLFFSYNIGYLSSFPLNMICIVIVAIISNNVIEKPFLRLQSKLALKNKTVLIKPENKSLAS